MDEDALLGLLLDPRGLDELPQLQFSPNDFLSGANLHSAQVDQRHERVPNGDVDEAAEELIHSALSEDANDILVLPELVQHDVHDLADPNADAFHTPEGEIKPHSGRQDVSSRNRDISRAPNRVPSVLRRKRTSESLSSSLNQTVKKSRVIATNLNNGSSGRKRSIEGAASIPEVCSASKMDKDSEQAEEHTTTEGEYGPFSAASTTVSPGSVPELRCIPSTEFDNAHKNCGARNEPLLLVSTIQAHTPLSQIMRGTAAASTDDPTLGSISKIVRTLNLPRLVANDSREAPPSSPPIIKIDSVSGMEEPDGVVEEVGTIGGFVLMSVRVTDPITCGLCSKPVVDDKSLEAHIKSKHPEVINHETAPKKKHRCEHCKQELKNETNLRRHITKVHSGPTTDTCDSCSATFSSRHAFVIHRRDHHGIIPVSVRRRIRQDYILNNIGGIKQRQKGMLVWKCGSCQKKSVSKGNIVRHIRIMHIQLRPHKCQHCSKTFPTKHNLHCHQSSIHPNIAPAGP